MTTIYLIRHSVRMPISNIESCNTYQNNVIRYEKIILNSEGEKRAKLLCEKSELQNIDVLYTSNCVRTLQTEKYMMELQKLKANIDERLDERRVGVPNNDLYPDWFERQYLDENYKTEGGESQKEVRERIDNIISEILKKYKNKRIAIFTHGYAITFYLLKYCKLLSIDDKKLKLEFNNKIVFNKILNAPELFKLEFDNDKLINIELIEFDDIPFNNGI